MNTNNNRNRIGSSNLPLKRVHIELTNIYNFQCVFCPKAQMKRPYGYMDVELAKRVINELKSNNICDKITFHIMGEPTLHPNFFEILDYARRKKLMSDSRLMEQGSTASLAGVLSLTISIR